MSDPIDAVGRDVRAFTAQDSTHGYGKVIAYTSAPTFLIETADGFRFSWRVDLTEVVERRKGERRKA